MNKFTKVLLGLFALTVALGMSACKNPFWKWGKPEDSSQEQIVEKTPLETPTVSATENGVTWSAVTGAEGYSVSVNGGEAVYVTETSFDLEAYYANNNELQVSVQAVPQENSNYLISTAAECTFAIAGQAVSTQAEIGKAVNLLTGNAMTLANDTTSIFDATRFQNLRIDINTEGAGVSTNVSTQYNLEDYLLQTSANTLAKAGMDEDLRVAAGYDFNVDAWYKAASYENTASVFYDMEYKKVGKEVGLLATDVRAKLSTLLSDGFLADVAKVGNGEMTAEAFVAKYGTHVVTSGTYGAKATAHYELLTDKTNAELMFGEEIEAAISAQMSNALQNKGMELDILPAEELFADYFASNVTVDSHIVFRGNAIGGGRRDIQNATSLADFSAACLEWSENAVDANNVLIDVPENSLVCIWDLLDDRYIAAKDILNAYFETAGKDAYFAVKDKTSDAYSESILFDRERSILTVDFHGLQAYEQENTTLANVVSAYYQNGVFTIPATIGKYNVEKVIFKGAYNKKDVDYQRMLSVFKDFSICFDAAWKNDIVVEFDSFAFEASAGMLAMDLSATQSRNIYITTKGTSYIKGGEGVADGNDGLAAILATGRNITLLGEETAELTIVGGNGSHGETAGKNGGNGGVAVIAGNIEIGLKTSFIGGNGGNGKTGANGENGVDGTAGARVENINQGGTIYGKPGSAGTNGSVGENGANGGYGASAVIAGDSVVLNTLQAVSFVSGNGGAGGKGGDGGNGGAGGAGGYAKNTSGNIIGTDKAVGGNGGAGGNGADGCNGGNGGNVQKTIVCENLVDDKGVVEQFHGEVGKAGAAGQGGLAGQGGVGGGASAQDVSTKGADGANGTAGQAGVAGVDGITENVVELPEEPENPDNTETEEENA